MTDRYGQDTTPFFYWDIIVMDRKGFAILPASLETEGKKVHVSSNMMRVPFEPLCGAVETDPYFIINMSQVESHPNICPECAAHPDIPLMMLGDA